MPGFPLATLTGGWRSQGSKGARLTALPLHVCLFTELASQAGPTRGPPWQALLALPQHSRSRAYSSCFLPSERGNQIPRFPFQVGVGGIQSSAGLAGANPGLKIRQHFVSHLVLGPCTRVLNNLKGRRGAGRPIQTFLDARGFTSLTAPNALSNL